MDDPFDLVGQMTRKDRQRLRLAGSLLDDLHPAWLLVPSAIRSAGQVTYGVLCGPAEQQAQRTTE